MRQAFFRMRSVDELTRHKPIDTLFISAFELMSLDERVAKVREFIKNSQIDFIVKSIYINPEFKAICLRAEFVDDWISLWSTYGVLINQNISKGLFIQSTDNPLDLFLGMYFYNTAVSYSKNLKSLDSTIIQNYLREAIKYKSVHACQMYHEYLYAKMDEKTQAPSQETEDVFHSIIDTIKKLLVDYRSYAYLMLAEAYVRYGIYVSTAQKNIPKKLRDIEMAATTCCEHAERLYDAKDPAIFNASFGKGLSSSNTLSMTTPSDTIDMIKAVFTQLAKLSGSDDEIATHSAAVLSHPP
jgi:hypothetical protein